MMKKFAVIALVLAVLAGGMSACGDSDAAAPTGYVTASGEAAGYLFFVPDDWVVDMATGATSAYCSANDPSSVSVMSWDLPNTDTTLDDWWEMNMEDITRVFQNVEAEEPVNVTLDGVHGQQYVYTASLGEYTYKILQAAAIKNGTVYLITYTSLTDTYDTHLESVTEMLGFFRFK